MRRTITIIGLQTYALVLAWVQSLHGVLTDEAKYLLNIPYPHPPVARWIMGLTVGWPFQDMLWRFIFATLLVQAVWLVISFLPREEKVSRSFFAAVWLLSVAVLMETGVLLMVTLTSLQALVLCRLLLWKNERLQSAAGTIALFWLFSLFTAYQAILFTPIVLALFLRMRLPMRRLLWYVGGPIVLLALYTFSHPLIIGSMVNAGTQNSGVPLSISFHRAILLWLLSGSAAGSLLGVIGMIRARRLELLTSLLLVLGFVMISFRPYYILLFLPLSIAGLASLPSTTLRSRSVLLVSMLLLCSTLLQFFPFGLTLPPSPAMATMRGLTNLHMRNGEILIAGSFGHEWQYESPLPVHRLTEDERQIDSSRAVVCLIACPQMQWRQGWVRQNGLPVETWVRTLEKGWW